MIQQQWKTQLNNYFKKIFPNIMYTNLNIVHSILYMHGLSIQNHVFSFFPQKSCFKTNSHNHCLYLCNIESQSNLKDFIYSRQKNTKINEQLKELYQTLVLLDEDQYLDTIMFDKSITLENIINMLQIASDNQGFIESPKPEFDKIQKIWYYRQYWMNLFEFNTLIKIISYIYENHLCMIYLTSKQNKFVYKNSKIQMSNYEREIRLMSEFWNNLSEKQLELLQQCQNDFNLLINRQDDFSELKFLREFYQKFVKNKEVDINNKTKYVEQQNNLRLYISTILVFQRQTDFPQTLFLKIFKFRLNQMYKLQLNLDLKQINLKPKQFKKISSVEQQMQNVSQFSLEFSQNILQCVISELENQNQVDIQNQNQQNQIKSNKKKKKKNNKQNKIESDILVTQTNNSNSIENNEINSGKREAIHNIEPLIKFLKDDFENEVENLNSIDIQEQQPQIIYQDSDSDFIEVTLKQRKSKNNKQIYQHEKSKDVYIEKAKQISQNTISKMEKQTKCEILQTNSTQNKIIKEIYINRIEKWDTQNEANSQIEVHQQQIKQLTKQEQFYFKLSTDLQDFSDQIQQQQQILYYPRQIVLKRIAYITKQLYPSAIVKLFGSCLTGLALSQSDIDISIGGLEFLPKQELFQFMSNLVDIFQSFKWTTNSLSIFTATVPVLKIDVNPYIQFNSIHLDKKLLINLEPNSSEKLNLDNECTEITQGDSFKVDISFQIHHNDQNNPHLGEISTLLINNWLSSHKCLKSITLKLKDELKMRNLNNPFKGGISSYCLLIMIVAFLVQNMDEKEQSIGESYMKLLQFYSTFDNKKVGINLMNFRPFYALNEFDCQQLSIYEPIMNRMLTYNVYQIDNIIGTFNELLNKLKQEMNEFEQQ